MKKKSKGFYKDYPNRKDHRKAYYDNRAFDPSCRSGGDCPHCISDRQHKNNKRLLSSDEQLIDYKRL